MNPTQYPNYNFFRCDKCNTYIYENVICDHCSTNNIKYTFVKNLLLDMDKKKIKTKSMRNFAILNNTKNKLKKSLKYMSKIILEKHLRETILDESLRTEINKALSKLSNSS